MPNKPFIIGQRWTSAMEPELGVGVVEEVEGRRVRIRFSQSGVVRTYGASSAPLERVVFYPGDRITGENGIPLTVEAVTIEDGLNLYHGNGMQLREDRLAATLTIHQPNARLMAGQRDPFRLFDLRMRVLEHRCRTARSPVCGFVGGRVAPIPHQFAIADQVCRRRSPRVLLADEAGLGKTIEAGLILHRLIALGRIARVLVIVPDALVVQWYVELVRRFNLRFRILDETFLATLPKSCADGALFENEPLMLCSFALVLQAPPTLQTHLIGGGWDTVVMDEAHRLQQGDRLFGPARRLAEKAPGLILITASPGPLAANRREPMMVFRTRRKDVAGFPGRQVHLVPLDMKGDDRALRRQVNKAFFQDCGVENQQEIALLEGDPRIDWLTGFLRDHRDEKVLLICRTRQTVNALLQALENRTRIKAGRFHEKMTLVQRDRNAAWFADPDGAAMLVCSEIGSEGRNFQFARQLVLFDLPTDPELLEQRIGRLDRIGRTGVVQVRVPFVNGTAGEVMARWYHDALNAFDTYLPAAAWVTRRFLGALHALAGNSTGHVNAACLDRLIRAGRISAERRQRCMDAEQERFQTAGRLQEDDAAQLVRTVRAVDADPGFLPLTEDLLDECGIGVEPMAPSIYRLEPDERYAHPLPGFRPAGLFATTDRAIALAREDLDFLTWDHPLVASATDLFLGRGKGTCAFSQWKAPGPPRVLLEMVFMLEISGGSGLPVDRFLPPTPIRMVVDQDLKSGESLLPDCPPTPLEDGSPSLFAEVLRAASAGIPQMVAAGQATAASRAAAHIENALRSADRAWHRRIEHFDRWRQASAGLDNAAVKADNNERKRALAAISRARPRLDAVRLIVKGDLD